LALGALLAAVVAVVLVVVLSGGGSSGRAMDSIFQDDSYLLYSPTPTVVRTLRTLQRLGVDTVRVQVLWEGIAPDPLATAVPRGFDGTNPASYPGWAPYDRLVRLASSLHLDVNFDVTAPGPVWAMRSQPPDIASANHYAPSARFFGQFVEAVGRRYTGSYVPPRSGNGALPRVHSWSVWNEPNQPGWLSPQWRTVGGQRVMDSPRLYREYVDAGFAALDASGHSPSSDTVLIGELAPEGCSSQSTAGCIYRPYNEPIPPIPFLEALYCVDDSYQPLHGAAAAALHCPTDGSPSAFVSANPGLFHATGFAHHPYSFFLAPNVSMSNAAYVPLADLSRLETALDRINATYGVGRQLPIYITEYGYETNPPNPFQSVTPEQQALFIDEAQFLAWEDPRVRSMSQFLLYDSVPNSAYRPGSRGYWSTFQTGLLYSAGARKPAYAAYRLPVFIPQPIFTPGTPVLVWGMLRPAPNGTRQEATVQWRPSRGGYRTIATVATDDPSGFFTAHMKLPGTGAVRVGWTSGGLTLYSREVGVVSR
jgi:hypothetical protein